VGVGEGGWMGGGEDVREWRGKNNSYTHPHTQRRPRYSHPVTHTLFR
jgi:hypothetical protein